MSQKKSAEDGMAEIAFGVFIAMFMMLWAAVAALLALVIKASQKTPEEQLRNMGAQLIFGAQLVGLSCPVCGESNEDDAYLCFRCGSGMVPSGATGSPVDLVPIDRLKTMFDELGRRSSLLVKGKTFKDAELPLAVGIVVTLLLVSIVLAIIS